MGPAELRAARSAAKKPNLMMLLGGVLRGLFEATSKLANWPPQLASNELF